MSRRALIAVIVSVAGTLVLGALTFVLLVVERPGTDEPDPRPSVPRPPPVPPVVGASEDLVLLGRTHRPRLPLRARAADGPPLWIADMREPRWLSDRWVSDRDGRVLDLEDGSVTQLPRATRSSIADLGDVLVVAGHHSARAFEAEDPSTQRWRIAGDYGWSKTTRFGDRIALFHAPPVEGSNALIPSRGPNDIVLIVDGSGSHQTFEIPGRARAATHDAVLATLDGTLSRVSLETREPDASLDSVRPGLVALGGFGDLTIWHESGFGWQEAEFADRRMGSRFFAWNPDEPTPRWETPAPHGSIEFSGRRDNWRALPDAHEPLPRHTCWPVHGERQVPMNGHRFVRVVCLDLEDGTITYRGAAGLFVEVRVHHDAQGTTLSVSEDDGLRLIRLEDRPVRAIALERGSITFAGDVAWHVEPGDRVTRLDAANPAGRELALDEVLAAPD